MSVPLPARVVLVHPTQVPASLREHVGAVAGQHVTWQESTTPAGHVLRAELQTDAAALREQLTGPAIALGTDVAVIDGPLLEGVGLVVCDADSTFFRGEMINELAAAASAEEQVARITAAAMAGELDFAQALRARVAALAGLPVTALSDLAARLTPSPGALDLLARVHAVGARLAVVSGGFSEILTPVLARLGVDHVAGNTLQVADGVLTGEVVGEIIDRPAKETWLRRWAQEDGVALERTAAVGDGANDLDMIAAAGLGVAFNAKPATAAQADAVITAERLDVLAEFLALPPP